MGTFGGSAEEGRVVESSLKRMVSSLTVAGSGRPATSWRSAEIGRRLLLLVKACRPSRPGTTSILLKQIHRFLKHVVGLRIVHFYFLG